MPYLSRLTARLALNDARSHVSSLLLFPPLFVPLLCFPPGE